MMRIEMTQETTANITLTGQDLEKMNSELTKLFASGKKNVYDKYPTLFELYDRLPD